MRTNNYYMHKNSKDICLYITKIFGIRENKFRIKAEIWNLGYSGNPYQVENFKGYFINPKDWVNITDRIHIKRVKDGAP